MRILFLTNYYPPYIIGGQEISCKQVVDGLSLRGHSPLVLTSMYGTNNVPEEESEVFRSLYLEMDSVPWLQSVNFFINRKRREKHNLYCFDRVVMEFKPDIVFIWGMWNLHRSLAALAETRYPGKVVYRFADYWPTLPSQNILYWQKKGRRWFTSLPKRFIGKAALALMDRDDSQPKIRFEHAICVSEALRDSLIETGISLNQVRVIHTGLDIGSQEFVTPHSEYDNKLSILYAGRLAAEKGVDTVVEAMRELTVIMGWDDIKLVIAGKGSKKYKKYLTQMVRHHGLSNNVFFLGYVPKEDMPSLFKGSDILVMPSRWQEPFSRIVLEGMVNGLVIVATPCGGTSEVIIDGENGLFFTPGDSHDLALKIEKLILDPKLREQLTINGRSTIEDRFTEAKMLDQYESYLMQVSGH